MPRPPPNDVGDKIYHVLNRGNGRATTFDKDSDYAALERVLDEGLQKYPVDLTGYTWMPGHWHMGLSPKMDGAMGRLLYWGMMTQTAWYHSHYHTASTGHLLKGRFQSFPIQSDEHFFVACRYVERKRLPLASSPLRKIGGSESCTAGPADDAASD